MRTGDKLIVVKIVWRMHAHAVLHSSLVDVLPGLRKLGIAREASITLGARQRACMRVLVPFMPWQVLRQARSGDDSMSLRLAQRMYSALIAAHVLQCAIRAA